MGKTDPSCTVHGSVTWGGHGGGGEDGVEVPQRVRGRTAVRPSSSSSGGPPGVPENLHL